MPRRHKTIAWMLLVEGSALLVCGAWLCGSTVAGAGASTSFGGLCDGTLWAVCGPVFGLVRGATGVLLALLGAAGLAGSRTAFRGRVAGTTRSLLLLFALPWGLGAIFAGLCAAAPQNDATLCLAVGAGAFAMLLLHVAATRPVALAASAVAA